MIRLPKAGDFYLLFHELPFAFDEDLPLDLGLGVCLDSTPQCVLDNVDPALSDYLLPGYNLPGMGLNNCCLRCYTTKAPSLKASDLFFVSLSALRLRAPIGIRIAGQSNWVQKRNRLMNHPCMKFAPPGNQIKTNASVHLT